MNNKIGGFGAKLLLVLILMIASAVAGAYGYRVLDGKMAVKDATKDIEMVDTSDYDSAEAVEIEEIIKDVNEKLGAAKTRKDVYDILTDFKKDVSKVKTSAEKEIEAAREAAKKAQEEAEQSSQYNQYSSGSTETDGVTGSDSSDSGSSGLHIFNSDSDNSSGSGLSKLFGNDEE